jgi:L-amino acid N-acyltransferase YncA
MSRVIAEMKPADWHRAREVFLEGIATGMATFETEAPEWEEWDRDHLPAPRLVARENGRIVGWVALCPVSRRKVYAGVAEVSVYIESGSRGRGIGGALLGALVEASDRAGIWTVQATIFQENAASLALHRRCGFREVGRRERIARLRGVWRDTLLLERRSTSVL